MSGLISKVNIKSYRGIDSLVLENLQKINILTGDNNSGKTSVLEIISTFGQPDIIRSWVGVSREEFSINGLSVYERLNDLFNVNCEEKKVEYIVETDKSNTKVELLAYDSEGELSEKEYYHKLGYVKLKEDENEESEDRVLIVPETHFKIMINDEIKEKISLYGGQRRVPLSLRKSDSKYSNNTIYIAPYAHISAKMFLKDVLDNPELYEEMLDVLKEFDAGIISINYDEGKTPGRDGVYKILSKANNKALPLNMYGDGMKKAILLMSAVVKAKDGILLLDEFETAIHTSAMEKVFEWILNTCLKLNVQVFMTSHSKEAIDKVLSCSETIQQNVAIYTLYKDEEGNSVRRLDGKKAIDVRENMGLELR